MVIKVTQKHILGGQRGNGLACPVALALRDAGVRATVGAKYINITDRNGSELRHTFQLQSRRVQRFVRDYDNNQPVKPFCFRLNVDA